MLRKNWIIIAKSLVRDILCVWLVLGWFWVGSGLVLGWFWGFRVGSLCMDGVYYVFKIFSRTVRTLETTQL